MGLDVDNDAFQGSALQVGTGEVADFKIGPTLKGLIDKLMELKKRLSGSELRVCYEASYVGFSLKRDLEAASIHCDVVAPSSIPRVGGNHVKTDRIDAAKLCQFYPANMLTIVAAPTPELEQDRDLLRSRQFIMNQLIEVRTHIQSMLRRSGRNYKSEENMKSHWTRPHLCRLDRLALESPGSFGITMHRNRYLRNAFCEANQRTYQKDFLHRDLKARRKEIPPELTCIADRCMERLS